MANVQHIFSGNGDPNTLQITAPAGSHYSDIDTDCEYIASASGKWHLILPVVRAAGGSANWPDSPLGSIFISSDDSIEKHIGVKLADKWAELPTVKSAYGVSSSTDKDTTFAVDTDANKLCVNIDGEWKCVDLTSLV